MVFSKVIQFKSWVNRFNEDRKFMGYAAIDFDCGMFSIGQWSVSLSLSKEGVFFSNEMERITTLLAGGGVCFWVGSDFNGPVLYFQ